MRPASREERRKLAQEIAERARIFRQDVLAVGIYGSVARDEDGPYSDLEMLCVLSSPGEDFTKEWIAQPCKVEVNFVSEDVLFSRAQEVGPEWSLTHGAYVYIRALHDPKGVSPKLKEAVLHAPHEAFQQALRTLIVEDLYEVVGKIRNAWHFQAFEELPFLAVHFAFYGALLVGLANRHLYRSASKMLADSLRLPERPAGYDSLCQRVLTGKLAPTDVVVQECEEFWASVEEWCRRRGIPLWEARLIPF